MVRPMIESMCPFFIVSNVPQTIAFYTSRLGFDINCKEPEEDPFFAIVERDGAWLFVKAGEALPLPNPKRDRAMKWDAYATRPIPTRWRLNLSNAARHSATLSGSRRKVCAASRSPTPMVMFSSLVVRERRRRLRRIW
jgi:hypothetical protein